MTLGCPMALENRRTFLRNAGAVIGALSVASHARFASASDAAQEENAKPAPTDRPDGVGLPQGWGRMRKLDVHNHVPGGLHVPQADWSSVENLVEAAQVLGIDKLFCSRPIAGGKKVDIAAVREVNNSVLAAMKRFPGRRRVRPHSRTCRRAR